MGDNLAPPRLPGLRFQRERPSRVLSYNKTTAPKAIYLQCADQCAEVGGPQPWKCLTEASSCTQGWAGLLCLWLTHRPEIRRQILTSQACPYNLRQAHPTPKLRKTSPWNAPSSVQAQAALPAVSCMAFTLCGWPWEYRLWLQQVSAQSGLCSKKHILESIHSLYPRAVLKTGSKSPKQPSSSYKGDTQNTPEDEKFKSHLIHLYSSTSTANSS